MIYLDNSATSFPKPPAVVTEYSDCVKNYCANPGRSAHSLSNRAAEKVFETRYLLSQVFNVQAPAQIAFTGNCTASLNIGLKGFLGKGDHLIISDMEHNSVYRPAMALQRSGVSVSIAKADSDGVLNPDNLLPFIDSKTKMVCITHASNVGGGINNLAEIGAALHKRGILFMVDAAQTAGSVPIDVDSFNIDILAFSGHKGLMGPPGTGGIYIREGLVPKTIVEGGTGSLSENRYQPDFLPDRLECGTVNLPGIAALGGSLKFLLDTGIDTIRNHEIKLTDELLKRLGILPGLRILGPATNRASLVSVTFDDKDPSDIAQQLNKKYGIAVRSGLHCAPLAAKHFGISGSLRISPGAYSSMRDIRAVANALKEILSS